MISGSANPAKSWPAEHLEKVPACPVCGSSERDLLHGQMPDRVFGIAPGEWDLYECRRCGSAWLDPRPDPESLPLAYEGYFTHEEIRDRVIVRRRGVVRRWLHDGLNGYMNHRYGTRRLPASAGGRWMAWLFPPLRAAADATCRHLPRPPDDGGRLLDVGCGNGAFLRLASEMGWNAEGLDFDPDAVRRAREAGLTAREGGIGRLAGESSRYDVITMSHVIEHVDDPLDLLRVLHGLLRPGGMLWRETPNLGSLGYRLYGRNWRDLDPPRHLTLFNAASLVQAMTSVGFVDLRQHWNGLVSFEVLRTSRALRDEAKLERPGSVKRHVAAETLAEFWEWCRPARREFLTVTARKPHG